VTDQLLIGWREWVQLPALGLGWLKTKTDTGARTSALHAFYTEPFERDGIEWVRFGVHPMQGTNEPEVHCEAPLLERRVVTDSGGHSEERLVIKTELLLGRHSREIEVTLTDRDSMLFRMLVGRTALTPNVIVEPGSSFLLGGDKNSPPESL
jgi:hypothetical protein